jgi:hypothetical protein
VSNPGIPRPQQTDNAAADLRRRGFALCKPDPAVKSPTQEGWPTVSLEADAFGADDQIGIIGGPLSDGNRPGHALVIVELDAADAVAKANDYLPETGMVDERPGKLRSHRYFLVPCDTIPPWAVSHSPKAAPAAIARKGHAGPFTKPFRHEKSKAEILKWVGTGAQVVCPPSVWTGADGKRKERRRWVGGSPGEPAVVEFSVLWMAVCKLAHACGGKMPSGLSWPWDPPPKAPPKASPFRVHAGGVDPRKRASAYVARMDPAISGQGGHDQTFYVARVACWGFDLGETRGFELLRDEYNPRCQPEWTEAELRHKCHDADTQPFDKARGWLLDRPLPDDMAGQSDGAGRGDADEGEDATKQDDDALPIIDIGELFDTYPVMREPVIGDLLRRGETMNIVSTTKVGKSWLITGLALSVAMGKYWLGKFLAGPGRVLVIDNELHPETLRARLAAVADKLGLSQGELCGKVKVCSLRGRLCNVHNIRRKLAKAGVPPGYFRLIIIDAQYRAYSEGMSENDNAQMAAFYNELDGLAADQDCALALVHHGTKGNQAEKSVTDVGAGAGSLSRAADTHLVIREHVQTGVSVLEVALRSFPPVEPLCLKWEWPLWKSANDLDPTQLKRPVNKAQEAKNVDTDQEVLRAIIALDPTNIGVSIYGICEETGYHPPRVRAAVARLAKAGQVARTSVRRLNRKGEPIGTAEMVEGVRRVVDTWTVDR